jgi:hypothetical protein
MMEIKMNKRRNGDGLIVERALAMTKAARDYADGDEGMFNAFLAGVAWGMEAE